MTTSRACIVSVLFAIASICRAAAEPDGPPPVERRNGVVWSESYEVGTKVAQMQRSPLLLFFTASWCRWCYKLEHEVLVQPQVMTELRKFVCVRLDVEKNHDIAMAFGVSSLPRVIAVNTHGEMVGDWLGYHEPENFLQRIADIQPYINAPAGVRKAPQVAGPEERPSSSNPPDKTPPDDPAQLTDLLGHKGPAIRRNAMEVLIKAGPAVMPALLDALGHEYLGVRITAWKIIRTLSATGLEFDPWAPRQERTAAIKTLQDRLANARPQTSPADASTPQGSPTE